MPDPTPRTFRFRREAGGYVAASAGAAYHDVRHLGRVVKIDGAWQAITPAGVALGEQYPTRLAAAQALEASPMTVELTAPQARALRYFGTPQPRSARRLEIGGCPRWDVVTRLVDAGLLERAGDPTLTFDHRLTEAGRAQLVIEAARRGWPLPWHRQPYVGDGADGARRSAEIDRTEADTLDRVAHAPGIERLLDSAARWDAQATELELGR